MHVKTTLHCDCFASTNTPFVRPSISFSHCRRDGSSSAGTSISSESPNLPMRPISGVRGLKNWIDYFAGSTVDAGGGPCLAAPP